MGVRRERRVTQTGVRYPLVVCVLSIRLGGRKIGRAIDNRSLDAGVRAMLPMTMSRYSALVGYGSDRSRIVHWL